MLHLLLTGLLPLIMVFTISMAMNPEGPMDKETYDMQYLVRPAKDSSRPAPVLILLHGYGGNESDLFFFSDQIPDHWLVISVRAPFAITSNQWKWYDAKLENDKIVIDTEAASRSRKALLQFIGEVTTQFNTKEGRVVLAGFSQGANMALSLALTEPEKILAAACFSGRFTEEIKPLIRNKEALLSKKVFIAHGTKDYMLPIRYAEENRQVLQGLGVDVTLVTDKIAHSVSTKELDGFVQWLSRL